MFFGDQRSEARLFARGSIFFDYAAFRRFVERLVEARQFARGFIAFVYAYKSANFLFERRCGNFSCLIVRTLSQRLPQCFFRRFCDGHAIVARERCLSGRDNERSPQRSGGELHY